jgi:hypothetical protein
VLSGCWGDVGEGDACAAPIGLFAVLPRLRRAALLLLSLLGRAGSLRGARNAAHKEYGWATNAANPPILSLYLLSSVARASGSAEWRVVSQFENLGIGKRASGYWSHIQRGVQIVFNLNSARRRLKLF